MPVFARIRDGLWAAQGISACVDELLSSRDFLVRRGKLFPALCDHKLGLFDLVQGIDAGLVCVFHVFIMPPQTLYRFSKRKIAVADHAPPVRVVWPSAFNFSATAASVAPPSH